MFESVIKLVVEQSPRVHAIHSSHNPIRCAGLHNPTVSEQYEPFYIGVLGAECLCTFRLFLNKPFEYSLRIPIQCMHVVLVCVYVVCVCASVCVCVNVSICVCGV